MNYAVSLLLAGLLSSQALPWARKYISNKLPAPHARARQATLLFFSLSARVSNMLSFFSLAYSLSHPAPYPLPTLPSSLPAADGVCRTNADCSRNGICAPQTKRCVCDSGWRGASCGQLDLGAVPKVAAYGMEPNVTSWGGNPVQGDDGKWHLFVAEITNGCGLAYWETNSQW